MTGLTGYLKGVIRIKKKLPPEVDKAKIINYCLKYYSKYINRYSNKHGYVSKEDLEQEFDIYYYETLKDNPGISQKNLLIETDRKTKSYCERIKYRVEQQQGKTSFFSNYGEKKIYNDRPPRLPSKHLNILKEWLDDEGPWYHRFNEDFYHLLEQVTERQRTIIPAYCIWFYTVEEIAQALKIDRSTVSREIDRALKTMRNYDNERKIKIKKKRKEMGLPV